MNPFRKWVKRFVVIGCIIFVPSLIVLSFLLNSQTAQKYPTAAQARCKSEEEMFSQEGITIQWNPSENFFIQDDNDPKKPLLVKCAYTIPGGINQLLIDDGKKSGQVVPRCQISICALRTPRGNILLITDGKTNKFEETNNVYILQTDPKNICIIATQTRKAYKGKLTINTYSNQNCSNT